MKRVAMIIGGILIAVGAFLLLAGLGVIHLAALSGQVRWTGWGAWGLAFGAACLVWANSSRQPKA